MLISLRKQARLTAGQFVFMLAFSGLALLAYTAKAHAVCSSGIPCTAKLGSVGGSSSPNASKSDSATCDADFMNQIYARSFLEASREVVMNETVIRKPDSVLEYTCFDQFASIAAVEAGPIFTESDRWDNVTVSLVSTGGGGTGGSSGPFQHGGTVQAPAVGSTVLTAAQVTQIASLPLAQLETALPTLAPSSLGDVLNALSITQLGALDPAILSSTLTNLPTTAVNTVVGGLTSAAQNIIQTNITSLLPSSVASLIPTGISGATQLITSLQSISIPNLTQALGNLNISDLTNAINVLPVSLINNISVPNLTSIIGNFSVSELTSFYNNLTSLNISSISPQVISNTLSALVPSNLTNLLNGLNITSLTALPLNSLTTALGNLSINDLTNTFSNLLPNVLGSLPSLDVQSVLSNLAPADLTALLNGVSLPNLSAFPIDSITNALGSLIPTDLSSVLNGLNLQNLTSLPIGTITNVVSNLTSLDVSSLINGLSSNILGALPVNELISAFRTFSVPDLSNILSSLSNLSIGNLPVGSIAGALTQLSQLDISNLLGGLSSQLQNLIKLDLKNFLPSSFTSLLNIEGSVLDVFNALLNFNPNVLANLLPSFSLSELTNVLNLSPSTLLNQLPLGSLTNVLSNFSVPQIGQLFSSLSTTVTSGLATLTNFGTQISNFFNGLSFSNLQNLVSGFSTQVLQQFSGTLTQAIGNLSPTQITQFFDNLNLNQAATILNQLSGPVLQNVLSNISGTLASALGNLAGGAILGSITGGFLGTSTGLFQYGPTTYTSVTLVVNMGTTKLDKSLEKLVLKSLDSYISKNFAHEFLGGTATGLNNSISSSIGNGSYICRSMADVWQIAKCKNFATDDSFQSFNNLITTDPRQKPAACTAGTGITADIIKVANNENWDYVRFDKVSDTQLHRMLEPGRTTSKGKIKCSDNKPIPTGVDVNRYLFTVDTSGNVTRQTENYKDKVCSNPSCYYDDKSDSCK